MAIITRTENYAEYLSTITATHPLPIGWQPGDYAVLVHTTNSAGTSVSVGTPSGWTYIAGRNAQSNIGTIRFYVKRLQAEDSAPSFTAANGDTSFNHRIYTVSLQNVDVLNPIDIFGSTNNTSNVTTYNLSLSSTTYANTRLFMGFTSIQNTTTTSVWSNGFSPSVLNSDFVKLAHLDVTSIGAYSTSFTVTPGRSYAAVGIALRESTTPQNQVPTADAGSDQSVFQNSIVSLSGSGNDADGTITGYVWRQVSGDPVTLSSATSQSPTFTTPAAAGDLVFGLTVTDDQSTDSSEDTVTVTVTDEVYWERWNGTAWEQRNAELWDGSNW